VWRLKSRPTLAAIAAAIALTLAGCGGQSSTGKTEQITVDDSSCASGWIPAHPGVYNFSVANKSTRAASVSLVDFGSGIAIAKLPHAAPGSVGEVKARLRPGGAYQWSCEILGVVPRLSSVWQVPQSDSRTSTVPAAPAMVSLIQLIKPFTYYRLYVNRLLARLRPQLQSLQNQLASANLVGAQRAWLRAHMTWLEIGEDDGAYGAFGNLGSRIDGGAGGLVGGTSNPKFTGFHRVELDLFAHRDLVAARRDTAFLSHLVGSLTPKAVTTYLLPTNAVIGAWTLRPHEILEDALRDTLSGLDDYGSGTQLASVTADAAATREILTLMAPLIGPRAHRLVATAKTQLAALDRAIAAAHAGAGRAGLTTVSLRHRQRIDAAAGAALETLAPVSELMQISGSEP
jgi:high-affinity iron transporter